MLHSIPKVTGAQFLQETGNSGGKALFIYSFIIINVFFREKVQNPKIAISAEFLLNLAPVRRRCNEIRYPRGF